MDEIVEIDRTKLTIENYEAVAIVKTTLKKENVKTAEMKVTSNMKKLPYCLCQLQKNPSEIKKEIAEKKTGTTQYIYPFNNYKFKGPNV